MATSVLYSAGAQLSLGELNKNITKVGKALTIVATGQKINSAANDSASFAISEIMREKLRTLEQDNQNVQNGSAMFKIASGGIENIVSELRELKQLAIDAANDSNSDEDRRVMQKVFDQKRANIEDIAVSTNYNGKRLLDGAYTHPMAAVDYRLVDIIPRTTVIGKPPGVTKKTGSKGTTAILQDNKFPELTDKFEAVNRSIKRSDNVYNTQRDIDCDFAFNGEGSNWSWSEEFRYNNVDSDTFSVEIFKADNANQQKVIEGFTKSLDAALNQNYSDALDDAVKTASNGKFNSLSEARTQFLTDLRADPTTFLSTFCGIDLNNADTGAITGADAGGSLKNSDDVVPDTGFTATSPPNGSQSTIKGMTFNWPTINSFDSQSDIKLAILSGLNSSWIENGLNLVEDSFGMSFQESGAEFDSSTTKAINVKFNNNQNDDSLVNLNGNDLFINMAVCKDLTTPFEENGKVGTENLDRAVARELSKAVMAADVNKYNNMPAYIKEGLASLVTGADDVRADDIQALVDAPNKMSLALSTSSANVAIEGTNHPSAAAGYTFMRYLAKQSEGSDISLKKILLEPAPVTDNQIGVKMNFDLSNVKSVDELTDEGFSILCGVCKQYINFKFDASLGADESTFSRDSTDQEKSDYVIGVRDVDITNPNSLAKAIFEGVKSIELSERKDLYANESDIMASKPAPNTIVNAVIDGKHGVRIAEDPSDPEGYVLLKEKGYRMDFVNSGWIIGTVNPGEVDNIDKGPHIPLDSDTEIIIGEPVYDYVEYIKEGNPITIHHGTKSLQAINFYIDSMRTKALKGAVPDRHDLERLLNDSDFIQNNPDLVERTKEIKSALDLFMVEPGTIKKEPLSSVLAELKTDDAYETKYPDLTMIFKFPNEAAARLKEYPQLKSQLEEALINKSIMDKANGEYVDILKAASGKTLEDVTFTGTNTPPMTPVQSSRAALRVIEGALTYALEEATNVGAYLQRLDFSRSNIETETDNVQAAESTIRDADMAKSITEYTKFNVLQQSAQAMLAQANQNQSSILSLLQ